MSNEKDLHASGEETEVSVNGQDEALQEEADSVDDALFLSPDDSEGEVIDVNGGGGVTELQQDLVAENEALKKQVEELSTECEEQKNRVLRVAADLENFRRRSQREKEDLRKYGIDRVVMELLPAIDNLERALQHATSESGENSMTEGVRMVYRQLLSALEKHGVEGFDSKGTAFDPQRHEALQQVESTELATGTVVDEYQRGYFLHDRLLRPALVSVAKNVQSVNSVNESNGADASAPSGQHDDFDPSDDAQE